MPKSDSLAPADDRPVSAPPAYGFGAGIMPDVFRTADWKKEKHVPLIEFPQPAPKGEYFRILASVGKEIAHPNKTEHHIRWIEIYFRPEGESFYYQLGKTEFGAHGASTKGPDTSTVYTRPEAVLSFKTDKPGTVYAFALCNIHGLWQGVRELVFELSGSRAPRLRD
jgi:superoxide reductase